YIGYIDSVQSLVGFLEKGSGRKFVVVSAIPELLEWIGKYLEQIFHSQPVTAEINENLASFFTNYIGEEPTINFLNLSEQLVNLLKGIALIGDYSPALKDQVITFAEKLSVEILLAQLNRKGKVVKAVWPEELDLRTTSDFGNATFISVNSKFIAS